jgi:hypothetical protein
MTVLEHIYALSVAALWLLMMAVATVKIAMHKEDET